jgi:hypothetical protein
MSDGSRNKSQATPPSPPSESAAQEARNSSAARNYMMFGFAGLLSMVPILLMKGMDLWCIFPLILGALSLIAHWRAGPIFVVLALAILVVLRAYGLDPLLIMEMFLQVLLEGSHSTMAGLSVVPRTPFLDFLLSVCVLAYLAGHYRLQALVHNVIPPEARSQVATGRRVKGQPEMQSMNPRRSPGVVTRWEIPLLGAAVLLSGLVGDYAWNYLHGMRSRYGMGASSWQTVTFIWCCTMILLVGWTLFSYRTRSRMTAEESLLYLQDQLWRQTRREQSRISRWIAWARVRYQRQKEEGS